MMNIVPDQITDNQVTPVAGNGLEPLVLRQANQIIEESGLLHSVTAGQRFPSHGRIKLQEWKRRWQDETWRKTWGAEDFL